MDDRVSFMAACTNRVTLQGDPVGYSSGGDDLCFDGPDLGELLVAGAG